VFQVRQDGAKGITIVGGSYVTPELYAGFRQPVVFSRDAQTTSNAEVETEVEVEYELLRGIYLTAEGGMNRISSFLRGRYAY
jgi:hypothetical protein